MTYLADNKERLSNFNGTEKARVLAESAKADEMRIQNLIALGNAATHQTDREPFLRQAAFRKAAELMGLEY